MLTTDMSIMSLSLALVVVGTLRGKALATAAHAKMTIFEGDIADLFVLLFSYCRSFNELQDCIGAVDVSKAETRTGSRVIDVALQSMKRFPATVNDRMEGKKEREIELSV
jgi:hypothetical protein